MSYKAFAAIKEQVELEIIKQMSPKEINDAFNQLNDRINELHKVASALREYIDAIPKNIQFTCTMPGAARDWVDDVIDKE